MKDRELVEWYKKYNRRYFGGKLPPVPLAVFVRFSKIGEDSLGHSIWSLDRWQMIEISHDIQDWDRVVRKTLLHEMVHLSLPMRVEHGPKFQKAMLRLAKLGAFKELW